jgi:hypothetical protein
MAIILILAPAVTKPLAIFSVAMAPPSVEGNGTLLANIRIFIKPI